MTIPVLACPWSALAIYTFTALPLAAAFFCLAITSIVGITFAASPASSLGRIHIH